ncbi:MAG: glycoside hydrolase family 97 N-terminal domain-containing protein [Verrucomicrobiales bacterium]
MSRTLPSLLLLSFVVSAACVDARQWHALASPGGSFAIEFSLSGKGRPLYRVKWRGDEIIAPGGIGFIETGGVDWTRGFKEIQAGNSLVHDADWKPIWGERSSVRDHYRVATFTFRRGAGTAAMKVEARAYDQGVAFRYLVDPHGKKKSIRIETEETRFRFTGAHDVWAVYSAQGKYSRVKIGDIKHSIERPCVLETQDGKVIAIAEAALVDFSRMRLRRSADEPNTLVSRLHGPVTSALPLKTPWRVVMAADRAGQLLENNDLLLNLNEPSEIADPGWIKPGKVIREVTLSTKGGLACVDFAVKNGLQFIEFDAGWYGSQSDEASDARTVSRRDLDLPRVIKYARENGIGVILYVNRRHLERDLDKLLPVYREWGIVGLKFGFVQHGDQKWTRWMHGAIAKCAEYRMMVDVHDEYRMTGWQRTYPNFMTAEGIGGDETRPTNKQALANLFNRMIAAPADHTFCYYSGHVDQVSSHASQLAKSVCFFSPWQFLFWYDQPSSAQDEPELEFFRELPTTWDDTRVLHGAIGRYAAIARRSGTQWFIGCFNGGKPRTLDLSLNFLEQGKKYEMRRYFDDPGSGTRTRVGIEKSVVDRDTVIKASMGERGGVAFRIFPAGPGK